MNFLAITTVVLALIILYRVIRVSVYDFKKTHVKKRILKFKQKNVKAGKVSVIILAENNKKTIVECLNSLFRSTIRKIEVIVIDNKSTDGTQQIVREYFKNHPKKPVRLVAKRKKSNNIHTSVASVQKYINGDYLIALRGDSEIDKYSLMQARSVFEINKNCDLLVINNKSNYSPGISLLLQTVNDLTYCRSRKISKNHVLPESNFMIKREAMASKHYKKVHFDSEIHTAQDSINIRSKNILKSIIQTRSNYLDITFSVIISSLMLNSYISGNMIFFLIGWIASTIDFVLLIASEDSMRFNQKFRLAFYAPISYVYVFLSLLILVFSLIKYTSAKLKNTFQTKIKHSLYNLETGNKPA